MRAATTKFIKSRTSASGFLKSGWIAAALVVKRKTPPREARRRMSTQGVRAGKRNGNARPARPALVSVVEFWNSAFPDGRRVASIKTKLDKALAKGFAKELASMETYLAKKMQKTTDKVNRQ